MPANPEHLVKKKVSAKEVKTCSKNVCDILLRVILQLEQNLTSEWNCLLLVGYSLQSLPAVLLALSIKT